MATTSMATIKAVGDWSKQMDIPLSNALTAIIEMSGRSGRQACEMAIIYMARSARAMTKEAKKNRKIEKDGKKEYVIKYNQAPKSETRWYKWQFKRSDSPITWEQARVVGNRGLAKRSWFWGLGGLSSSSRLNASKPLPVTQLYEMISPSASGLIFENRLGYILKAAPNNVADQAAEKASNQIMAQAAKKLEKQFSVEVPRLAASRAKKAQTRFENEFRKRAA